MWYNLFTSSVKIILNCTIKISINIAYYLRDLYPVCEIRRYFNRIGKHHEWATCTGKPSNVLERHTNMRQEKRPLAETLPCSANWLLTRFSVVYFYLTSSFMVCCVFSKILLITSLYWEIQSQGILILHGIMLHDNISESVRRNFTI